MLKCPDVLVISDLWAKLFYSNVTQSFCYPLGGRSCSAVRTRFACGGVLVVSLHFLWEPIITLDTKLTMALAGCSGSCSANRWHMFSVSLWSFLATNPKTLEDKDRDGHEYLSSERHQHSAMTDPLNIINHNNHGGIGPGSSVARGQVHVDKWNLLCGWTAASCPSV